MPHLPSLTPPPFFPFTQRQEERRRFYGDLRDRCRDLAVNLLAACSDMWDVSVVVVVVVVV